uniref:Uncharacterized protein n=1 Tax=Rhodotorula toruloides (strain NP11) TaxID=1130832 RepID=A0A7G8ZGF9_RHOT1|nr:hypothetical protein JR093_mgp10 [Rhodotorula toruloides]QNL17844.1 hypothetical protein [Rhodotorula toruloides]CAE5968197.1 hypothetical protein [Rhodotorula toruloides]
MGGYTSVNGQSLLNLQLYASLYSIFVFKCVFARLQINTTPRKPLQQHICNFAFACFAISCKFCNSTQAFATTCLQFCICLFLRFVVNFVTLRKPLQRQVCNFAYLGPTSGGAAICCKLRLIRPSAVSV